MKELKALRKQLSIDQTSSIYADQFFSSLSTNKNAENFFTEIAVSTIERYKDLNEIIDKLEDPKNFSQIVMSVLRLFPSYGFIICNELSSRPDFYEFTKSLRISIAASCIARKADYQANANLFLNQIDSAGGLEQLENRLIKNQKNAGYLLRVLYQDLVQLTKTQPKFRTTTNPHELIETTYYFKAVKQVFLKYYFYLIGHAQTDVIAVHINRMFSRLLLAIRSQEIKYWSKYKSGKQLQSQLAALVAKDLAKSRHPHLRKHIFEGIDKFNPVFQDGTLKSTVIEVRQLLMKQLAIFYDLSINKLVLMLDTTQKTEGNEHVTFLLTQLSRTNIEKLFDLQDHLDSLPADKTRALQQVVTNYSSKLPGAKRKLHDAKNNDKAAMATVYKTAETLRTVQAKKRLVETEGKRGMTYEEVPAFLEERLKKLYERVKKEGALTHDQVPEYLARFAAAAEMMIGPIAPEKQEIVIEEFKNATEEILVDISSEGHLTTEEFEDYKSDIREKADSLNTQDAQERTELVDEIGVTLSEASFASSKRKETEELKDFFSKHIIPYGLDKKAKRVSVEEFFQFPFGDFNGPADEDWFSFHMRYLQLAVKENKLDKSNFVKIFNSLSHLPRIKYKKYFNIFPNEQFEETTFMAVYDLWQNKAFERLRSN
jgi:hypothetical protein